MNIRSHIKVVHTLFFISFFIIVLGYILIKLYLDIQNGGHSWRQGDWLINNQYFYVRRGIFGSMILSISSYLSLSTISVLGFTQGVLATFTFTMVFLSIIRLGVHARVLFLMFSPGFVFLFWFLEFEGSFRKELLVYFSFSIIISGILFRCNNYVISILSSLIFIFAVFSHEANFFFLPFFVFALYIWNENSVSRKWYLIALIVFIFSLGGLGYAITFSSVPNPIVICMALIERGLSENLCTGSISYLNQDMADVWAFVKRDVLESNIFMYYLFAYFLSLVPLIFVRPIILKKKYHYFLLVVGILAFSPLFIIAIDWGRWINFYITSVTMILIMHMNLRKDLYLIEGDTKMSFKVFVVIFCLLWNMPPCCQEINFGLVAFTNRVVTGQDYVTNRIIRAFRKRLFRYQEGSFGFSEDAVETAHHNERDITLPYLDSLKSPQLDFGQIVFQRRSGTPVRAEPNL